MLKLMGLLLFALGKLFCWQNPGGEAVDSSGAPVAGARISLKAATGTQLAEVRTDSQGRFQLPSLPEGQYALVVEAPGFSPTEALLRLPGESKALRLVLTPGPVITEIDVTARRGLVQELAESPALVTARDRSDLLGQPLTTIGNALERSPGIHMQQTTTAQVSPFLRGLTGYQVVNVIDGIRYNNSTFRSGPNQYLAFFEPDQAQRIEAALGPSGVEYGSDSLGGTIQVLTREPRFYADGREMHGEWRIYGGSADLSAGTSALLQIGSARGSWLGGGTVRRHNDLRAGGGADSRHALRRMFLLDDGAIREFTGSRQQDSAFSQYGFHTKLALRPREFDTLTLWYQASSQEGVRNYKDLWGGLGRMRAGFDPQSLHLAYLRYERFRVGFLDSVSGTFSFNSQRDGSVRQSLRATDLITRDDSRVDAFGYTGQASKLWSGRHALLFGGELFHERIYSRREETNPLTGAIRSPRPLFPDDSRYRTWGLFAQNVFDWSRFRATLGGRLTGINYQTPAAFGLPASSLDFRDLTFHASGLYRAASWLGLHARVGRGFRAPNANDLGALGLNDLGFEIPASEAVPAGALLATTAGENALSSGKALRSLQPERLFNYEVGVQVNVRRVQARAQVFNNELYDPIVRRTLLFPAASPPSSLAGLPVTPIPPTPQQREQGVVTVATALDPRAVKAFVNDGRARYYGVESLTRVQMSSRWSAEANYTFLVGRELNPNRNVRRLPPQQGTVRLRYQPARRWWAEAGITAAGAQERLSGGDLDDERIGAARSRRDIEQFFLGTRISPAISGGVFRPTGETLRQIQDRVLPLGAVINGVRVTSDTVRVPLYTRTAGWATVDFRGGFQVSESFSVNAALLNLLDKNYRFHGAGVDAPGINAYMGLLWRF